VASDRQVGAAAESAAGHVRIRFLVPRLLTLLGLQIEDVRFCTILRVQLEVAFVETVPRHGEALTLTDVVIEGEHVLQAVLRHII